MDIIESLRVEAATYGGEPLLALSDGQIITLSSGYVPLLANFTFEDKAAKGLRKRTCDDKPELQVHFSALELVRDFEILLLSGPSGSGKTTFAKYLAFILASTGTFESHPVIRNENGTLHNEHWEARHLSCLYFKTDSPESLKTWIDTTVTILVESLFASLQTTKPTFLIIIDAIEEARNEGAVLLAKVVSLVEGSNNIRLLLLGDDSSVKHWILPSKVARHDILPLLERQRREAIAVLSRTAPSEVVLGLGTAAATPALFALALEAKHCGGQAEELLDGWLTAVAPTADASNRLGALALELNSGRSPDHVLAESNNELISLATLPTLFSSKVVQQLLAARHLASLAPEIAIELFDTNPLQSTPILRSLLVRLGSTKKFFSTLEGLVYGSGVNARLGALLVSEFIDKSSKLRDQILNHMLSIVEESTLSTLQREKAGRVLARLGDPRDLTALTGIPAGKFILGSLGHPNSQPPEITIVQTFHIGVYPVVNRDFSVFVRETGRDWKSPDGLDIDKQNLPATDLSWYDAMAYCKWLTLRWRLTGKVGAHEQVRLPTEPEWEYASRGGQTPANHGEPIYPWGTEWQYDAANYDETGLNMRCSVGLFPKGRSPFGCYDMAGQVWEWCTTLWGEDMTTPFFQYPWRDDGREDLDAPGSIRRVLRGGCFSSVRPKLCCTYRGSLEPGGSWRGNGFRIVVARTPS